MTFQSNRLSLITCIIIGAAILRILLFNDGIRGSDAYLYAMSAHEIAQGTYNLDILSPYYELRYVLLLPTAICYALFGVNDVSSSLYPLTASLLNIYLIFLLGKRLFNRGTALFAAFLTAIFPLDIMTATLLSPDSILPLLSSLAMLLYVIALTRPDRPSAWQQYLLCGIVIGLAASVRITSFFLFFALLCHCTLTSQESFIRQARIFAIVSIGMALPFLSEAIYAYVQSGDILLRLHRTMDAKESLNALSAPNILSTLMYYPKGMLGFELTGLATHGFTWWFAIGGIVLAWKRHIRHFPLLLTWIGVPLFGYICIALLTPLAIDYRLLSIASPPMLLFSGYCLASLMNRFLRNQNRLLLALLLAGLTAMHAYGAARIGQNIEDDAAPYIAVANLLKEKPCRNIYVHHPRWPLFLKYYLRYNECSKYENIMKYSRKEILRLKNGVVIIHPRYMEADTIGRPLGQKSVLSELVKNPPDNWKKVLSYKGNPSYNNVYMYVIDN